MVSLKISQRPLVSRLKIRNCPEGSREILAALYFVGGVRVTFSTGIAAGGNLAYW
jgi:hypothetical protein